MEPKFLKLTLNDVGNKVALVKADDIVWMFPYKDNEKGEHLCTQIMTNDGRAFTVEQSPTEIFKLMGLEYQSEKQLLKE